QNAILSNTRLTKVQLSGTNIDAVRDFRQADLERANLRGTNVGPVVCVNTRFPDCVLNLE
ncbi:pentapeptide repeat-containing protein, partial [Microcoleus sp. CAWBG640]